MRKRSLKIFLIIRPLIRKEEKKIISMKSLLLLKESGDKTLSFGKRIVFFIKKIMFRVFSELKLVDRFNAITTHSVRQSFIRRKDNITEE